MSKEPPRSNGDPGARHRIRCGFSGRSPGGEPVCGMGPDRREFRLRRRLCGGRRRGCRWPSLSGASIGTASATTRRACGAARSPTRRQPTGHRWKESLDLWAGVRALPRRQQEAVVLHYRLGLPTEEVARAMGSAARRSAAAPAGISAPRPEEPSARREARSAACRPDMAPPLSAAVRAAAQCWAAPRPVMAVRPPAVLLTASAAARSAVACPAAPAARATATPPGNDDNAESRAVAVAY